MVIGEREPPEIVLGAGVGVVALALAVFVWRLRGLLGPKKRVRFAASDFLLFAGAIVSVVFVIVPVVMKEYSHLDRTARSSLFFSVVLALGWLPAILAHHRIVFGKSRTGERQNPEPLEVVWILVSLAAATVVCLVRLQ